MAKIVDYFKFPTPGGVGNLQAVTDNTGIGAGGFAGMVDRNSWTSRLVQGAGTRIARYREWEIMDNTVEVSRALDTIAQHMCSVDQNTKLPVVLNLQQSETDPIDGNVVMTLRAALRHWVHSLALHTRLFHICRATIKNGDTFFRRRGLTSTWEFLSPNDVIAALVDENDPHVVVGWQIRVKKQDQDSNIPTLSSTYAQSSEMMSEIVPAADIIRFTLCDDMSEEAPFGKSVLSPVLRAFKQKELLETAILIYRIQRAPERRVFYIETGKMPPARQEAYLERLRNEIRQSRTVNKQTGDMDSVYNPHSMMEDIFLAQTGDGKGHKVEVLPGGQGLGELSDLEYFEDLLMRGLRVPVAWMKPGANNAILNDTKVGAAYVEEQQFITFVEQLQVSINRELDKEFKRYVAYCGFNIDPSLFTITLQSPNNYEKYRKAMLDAELLNTFGNIKDVQYISPRFAMSRFLQMSDEEIATNEMLRRQELGLSPIGGPGDYAILYGVESPDSASLGGDGGGFGGGLGGGGAMPPLGDDEPIDDTAETDMNATDDANAPKSDTKQTDMKGE